MKIAVAGASGLIGTKVVDLARSQGHDVVPIGRSTGFDLTDAAVVPKLTEALAGVGEAGSESVDPEPAVRVEHDLDDGGLIEPRGDVGAERGCQHAPAARQAFGLKVSNGHWRPRM